MIRPVALALFLLIACDDVQDAVVTQSAMSDNMLYVVKVTPDPAPPVAGETSLAVHIAHHDTGDDIVGATLSVEPWMTSMDHGVQGEPVVTEGSNGDYTATFVFSMPGTWDIRMQIDGSNGQDDAVVTFDVQ